jgi:hypothetical protein
LRCAASTIRARSSRYVYRGLRAGAGIDVARLRAMTGIRCLAIVLCCVSACNDPASMSTPDAQPATMESGVVVDFESGSAATPIAGAKVCILDNLDHLEMACATTDDNGAYTIALPPIGPSLSELAVSVTATGYLGYTGLLFEEASEHAWPTSVPLMDDTGATALLHTQAGFEYPSPGAAFVYLSVFHGSGGADVGVTASVAPAASQPPVYIDATGTLDPTLTSLTSDGYMWFGGVVPGDIEITVSDTSCIPVQNLLGSWNDSKPNTIAGAATANSYTQMYVICQ